MSDRDENRLPDYPRLTEAGSVRLSRVVKFRTWSGRAERLVKLQNQVEKSLEALYRQFIGSLSPEDEYKAREAGQYLRTQVHVVAVNGRVERTGSLESILGEVDTSEIERISIGNAPAPASGFPTISIHFARKPREGGAGAVLTVTGSNREWVAGVVDALASDLEKCDPKWSVMRTLRVPALIGLGLGLGTSGLIFALAQDTEVGTLVALLVLSIMFGPMLGMLALGPLLQRAFPAFEIVEPGESSQAGRLAASILTTLSLLLSIAGVVLGFMAL